MQNETKEERFKRVAGRRVQAVLDGLRKLSNCSNPRVYSWEEEQVRKMWSAVDQEYKKCKAQFSNIRNSKNFKF